MKKWQCNIDYLHIVVKYVKIQYWFEIVRFDVIRVTHFADRL